MHHSPSRPDDIREAVKELECGGHELGDVKSDNPDWREAFLQPSTTHGTLIRIAPSALPDEEAKEQLLGSGGARIGPRYGFDSSAGGALQSLHATSEVNPLLLMITPQIAG